MTKPTLLVFSPAGPLPADVTTELARSHRIEAVESLEAVAAAIPETGDVAVLADVRTANDGGHGTARWLETLAASLPDVTFALVVPAECPEPLERVALEHGVTLLSELTASSIVTAFPHAVIDEPASTAAAPSALRDGGGEASRTTLAGITRSFETNTLKLKRMLNELEVAARHDVTILLVGETGSGKTFLSRLVHEVSPRRDEPFLHVACGALPADLIESELFGHKKGAFTSASDDKVGKFLAAGGGTILLDEIDVLAPEQQVKLLRVIETGEFEPVGSNVTHKTRARLVVASNLDLQPLVERGRFRPDLYYRLNMLKFEIAPLRERPADVEPLLKKFVAELSAKHGVTIAGIDVDVLEALRGYPWPGNVRELENVIRRAVIYSTDGVLRAEHLPPHVLAGHAGPSNDPSVNLASHDPADRSLGDLVAINEKQIIEQALFENEYSKTRTAKSLGISRVTLYNKLKKFGMQK